MGGLTEGLKYVGYFMCTTCYTSTKAFHPHGEHRDHVDTFLFDFRTERFVAYVALSTGDFDLSFLRQLTRDESVSDGE
jgi:hypothetical protein